jgi:hypothetical protein
MVTPAVRGSPIARCHYLSSLPRPLKLKLALSLSLTNSMFTPHAVQLPSRSTLNVSWGFSREALDFLCLWFQTPLSSRDTTIVTIRDLAAPRIQSTPCHGRVQPRAAQDNSALQHSDGFEPRSCCTCHSRHQLPVVCRFKAGPDGNPEPHRSSADDRQRVRAGREQLSFDYLIERLPGRFAVFCC